MTEGPLFPKKKELQLKEQSYSLNNLESEVDDNPDSPEFIETPYQYSDAHSEIRVWETIAVEAKGCCPH